MAARTGFPQGAGGVRTSPLRPGPNGRSGSHPLLELQRRYGNRYVQRLVDPSRVDGNVARPTVPALVVQLRERTDQGKGEDAPRVGPQPGTPAETRGVPERTSAAPAQAGAARSEPPSRTEHHGRAPHPADAGPRTPVLPETSAMSEDLRSPASGKKAPEGPHQDPAYQAVVRQLRATTKTQKTPPKEPKDKQLETRLAANLTPQEALKQEAIPDYIDALAQAQPPDLTTDAFMAQFGAAVQSVGDKLPRDKDAQEHVSTGVAIAVETGKAKASLANQTETIVGPLRAQAGKKLSDFPVAEAPQPHELKPDPPGTVPTVPNAGAAAVKPKADAEISLDDKSGELDDVLANQQVQGQKLDIDEASLALPISGEPTFDEAGEAKRKAQQEIAKSKPRYRDHERQVIGVSGAEMRAIASGGLAKQYDARSKSFGEVLGVQNTHKSNIEEKKRAVLHELEGIYDETKGKVDNELKKLADIEDIFDGIVSKATEDFSQNVEKQLEFIYTPGVFDYSDWKDEHAAEIEKERDALQNQGENFYVAATKALDIVRKRSADAYFATRRSIFMFDLRWGVEEKIATKVVQALNAARGHIRSGKERVKTAFDKLTPQERQEFENVLSGVMGRFDSLEESVEDRQREIVTDMARAYNQGVGKLQATFDTIRKDVLTSWFEKAWNKLKAVVNAIIDFATRIAQLLGRLANLIGDIVASPRAFFSHLGEGISQGFSTFINRIDEFLATAFFDWLRGSSGLPFQMPKDWSPKGLFGLFTQLLNLSVETVWQRMEAVYGKATASAFRQGEVVLDKGLEIFSIIRTEGLGGLWDHISESLGNILGETLDTIKETVLYAAIRRAIIEIGKLIIPGGGFIAIAEKVIRFLQFIVDARDRILDLIESFVDAVEMAVKGNVQGIVNRITGALTKFITLALDFLVDFFGLGALKDKVTRFIERMRKPVISGIDWLLGKFKPLVTRGMRLLQKGKQKLIGAGKAVVQVGVPKDPNERLRLATEASVAAAKRLSGKVTKALLNPVLAGIRVRYGLATIQPYEQSGTWWVRATINPTQNWSLGLGVATPAQPPPATPAQPPPLTVGTVLSVKSSIGPVRGVFVGYGEDIKYADGSKDRTVRIKTAKDERRYGFRGFGVIWFVPPPSATPPPAVHYSASTFPFIRQNIKTAIARGYPSRLKYLQDSAKADANRRAALASHRPAKSGFSLDEYPFASTYQGGCPGGVCAQVREVPETEQDMQGGKMSSFYQNNKLQDGDEFDVLV
jgi:hypothetical protein